ncbi:MAG: Fic family protein [Cytophagaceae bacterium]|jgi:fido (protein-threonine AMPylation protein)|nr:Fic family protein [Cytophagaceae bacterium]
MKDFEEYIRHGEPSQKEKAQNWQIAIGLQQVDGLTPSEYLLENARQNIEGDITIDEVKKRIDNYYKQEDVRKNADSNRTEEADKVSLRITEMLSNTTFNFSSLEYIAIHRRLFTGIYKFAGKIRDYNITKSEWVLDGKTVLYSDYEMIRATLDYDFNEEKGFKYKGLSKQEQAEHIAKFVSELWQIHVFGEGNTRTTAVFTIKYLRSFGFKIGNEVFSKHSWYFRNALVRANYNDWTNGIHATQKYLMNFFGNILFNENNSLKNRELHIGYGEYLMQQEIKDDNDTVKLQNDTVSDTVKLKFDTVTYNVFILIKENPSITADEIRSLLNIGIATVKRKIKLLKDENILTRLGSDKTGTWQITNN